MSTLRVVDMTPAALSGNVSQDSEPNLAVNPETPTDMVATAFTPDPMGGAFAPVYVSVDGGSTWALNSIVPGNDSHSGTGDITVGFATSGGVLYAGILNGSNGRLQLLRSPSVSATAPMTVLVDRDNEDQPWVVAGSLVAGSTRQDHVYVGNNNLGRQPATATVDVSADAATGPAPGGFAPVGIERRRTSGQDGPPTRIALHPGGTVYAAFHSWQTFTNNSDVTLDIVVTRDDHWATGPTPFSDLKDAKDGLIGQRVATGRFVRFNAMMGQERLGGDLAIAVDPADPASVWIAWCDRIGGATGTDWTLHVQHSTDQGQSWSTDVRTVTGGKNPALAVGSGGLLGLTYQQFTRAHWITTLELTHDSWATPPEAHVLHQSPASVPAGTGQLPYLGDYIRLLAIGPDFYGVFSGNNTPDKADFPSGITYQRGADWTNRQLLDLDGVTRVPASIDPFFFHYAA